MIMKNKDLEEFILQYTSYGNRLYDNTSISRDLNIRDEVAFDFIRAYSKQFDVDISSFDFIKYFPPKDELSKSHEYAELTTGDLMRGIVVGELNDDVIAFDENDPNLPLKFSPKKIILAILLVLAVTAVLGVVAFLIP